MTDQDSISKWEAPFPVHYSAGAPQDDVYWKNHRTTPKAFVSLAAGRRLWGSRFGQTTSLRLPVPAVVSEAGAGLQLTATPHGGGRRTRTQAAGGTCRSTPDRLGFAFLPLKQRGLAAAAGTTPFDVLFLFLSFFIIAAALLLVALLFRLGVEQRAEELGMLAGRGLAARRSVGWFLTEGVLVAAVGGGRGRGVGRGLCRPDADRPAHLVAGSDRHTLPATACRVAEPGAGLRQRRRRVGRHDRVESARHAADGRNAVVGWRGVGTGRWRSGSCSGAHDARAGSASGVALAPGELRDGLLVAALVLAGAATRLGGEAQAGAFVGSGILVLPCPVAADPGPAAFAEQEPGARRQFDTPLDLLSLAGGTPGNPGRSTTTIGLMAVATFLIVAMSAFHQEPSDTGTGGFALLAESSEPVLADLNRPELRGDLLGDDAAVAGPTARCLPYASSRATTRVAATSTKRPSRGCWACRTDSFAGSTMAHGPLFAWVGTAAQAAEEQANPWRC